MIKEDILFDLIQETIKKLDPKKDLTMIHFLEGQASFEGDEHLMDGVAIVESITKRKKISKPVWDLVFNILFKEVEDGNHWAMNELGAMFYDGTGCQQSFKKAVDYYKMAAALGNRQAQENLGYCYYYGRNMPIDYGKAFHYFAMGAFDGHLVSLYKIGDMYMNGYYVDKNEVEAASIYLHCLDLLDENNENGVAGPVYLRLGDVFLYGKGVKNDLNKALVCYQKAEYYLYRMVEEGLVMYNKSLQKAIEGQEKTREIRMKALSDEEWTFDD